MAIPTDQVLRLYRQITLEEPKPHNLSADESQLWDRVSAEVAAIKKKGQILDAPFEFPEISAPK